uniref:Putative carboxymethylenebutenolidase n=1 Tax=uncultured bacterium contig00018 TaxID=1181509 RepID=A0A806K0W4_9BACT|nr:putative carboxymethylenebutenolidase [uncultured bacterium contig00018]
MKGAGAVAGVAAVGAGLMGISGCATAGSGAAAGIEGGGAQPEYPQKNIFSMWNQIRTDEYGGLQAESVTIPGYNGDPIHAYVSRPVGNGPFPGVILIPHMPGWDEWSMETVRRFTHHGCVAICPNIYERFGHGLPTEIAGKARESGGVYDDSVMGDCQGALDYLVSLPYSNGRVGVIGMCSGGRHAFLAGCRVKGLNAAVDCWGGGVVQANLTAAQPVAPIDLTAQLSCPLLGIFGNDDRSPSPEQVNQHEEELKKHGKDFTFHRYDGAGHGFWYYDRENYRPVQTMDSLQKVYEFFGKHLKV